MRPPSTLPGPSTSPPHSRSLLLHIRPRASAQIRLQECDDIPCFRVTVFDSRFRRTIYKTARSVANTDGGAEGATPLKLIRKKQIFFYKTSPTYAKTHTTKLINIIDVVFSNRTPSKEYIPYKFRLW